MRLVSTNIYRIYITLLLLSGMFCCITPYSVRTPFFIETRVIVLGLLSEYRWIDVCEQFLGVYADIEGIGKN